VNLADDLERSLVQAVSDFIGDPINPPVVRLLIGHEAMTVAPPGMNGPRYAVWLVGHVLRLPKPDVFARVVKRADRAGALPDLHALLADLDVGRVQWSAPEAGLWIPAGWPFLDRETLRITLDQMAAGGGPPALSIEGSTGDGKKTMAAYIEHLAARTDSFFPVIRELRSEPGTGALFPAATELYMAFPSQADLATTHEEPERQARAYARDIAAVAPNAPGPVWFVANVIGQPDVEDGLLPFVDELLRLVQATPEIAQKLRVLVLCDRLAVLPLEHAPAASARHTLPQITDTEIRQWLEAAAPGKSQTLYELAAERVLRSLDSQAIQPWARLRMLAVQCKRAHSML
jgi:hypothetical protein